MELIVYDGSAAVARHERLLAKGGCRLELDHYLEILVRKPGALPGAVRRTFPGPPMSSSYEATELGQLVGDNLIRMVDEGARTSQRGAAGLIVLSKVRRRSRVSAYGQGFN